MPKLYNAATNKLDEWPWDGELGTVYGPIAASHSWDATNTSTKSPAAKICDKAANLIDGERDKQHGERAENFGTIADLWTAYTGMEIKPHQVAWMMVLMKAARETNGTHNVDNAIDACGYAALAGELAADQDHGC